jgi:hypothetical protein
MVEKHVYFEPTCAHDHFRVEFLKERRGIYKKEEALFMF